MEKQNLFSIGDMAKTFHLSVSSLRYYEKIGLVMPEIAGFSREITIIDYEITNDTKKFVTEISIPVMLIS